MKKVFGLFITGIMVSAVSFGTCTKDDIKKYVDDACKLLVDNADESKAFVELKTAKFNGPCDSYVWVHGTDKDITMRFHPVNAKLVNKPMLETKDVKGKFFFREFVKVSGQKDQSGYVEYFWPKPGKAEVTEKCSYMKNCNGKHVAGMGIYGKCKDIGVADYK